MSKVTRHLQSVLQQYHTVAYRITEFNFDIIGLLPSSNRFRPCFTTIDQYSRWIVYRHIPVEPSDIGNYLPPGHHSVSTLMVFSLRQTMMKPNVSVILEKLQDFLRLQDTGIVMKVSKCQFLKTEARTWKRQHHSRCPVTNGRIASSNSNLLRRYSNDKGNGHRVKRHSNFP
ncbi:hypothetical protein TNCV_4516691 [Trichonephila clavipes]|nr:hypothetical protein TNCV_4516691 [Trichonephila clavipes]